MEILKATKWIRSPNFQKLFATAFGITISGNYVRLDFGNEQVQFSKDDTAYVSETQIMMDLDSFEVFYKLLTKHRKKIRKSKAMKK